MHIAVEIALCPLAKASSDQSANRGELEREAITATLNDFRARDMELLPIKDGVLLIQPVSGRLAKDEPRSYLWSPAELTCKMPRSLATELLRKNGTEVDAASLVKVSKHWRLIDKNDKARGIEDTLFFGSRPGERVKTVLSIYRPALSPDLNRAFVYFNFRWSIHGADAHYLLEREGNGWKVDCTQFFFYP
jgi:hypothetical protein